MLLVAGGYAQKSELPKFGKVDAEIFSRKAYPIDSSAPAVILLDVGRTEIIGNRKGWFSMQHTHRRRVHILNKDGYEHANDVIRLYKDNDGATELVNLKCVTFNLEGGKVVETKLEKSQAFDEQVDKYRRRIRFTAPAVKEGSVVEYEYTTVSDFYFSLVPWAFQGTIPRLWSEYEFSLPQFMDYLFFSQGYFPFHIKEHKSRQQFFTIIGNGVNGRTQTFTTNVTDNRWVMKDVPVIKEERFTSTINNHLARIEFQLAGYKDPLEPRTIMTDWPSTVKSLLEREDFGKLFLANNGWLDDIIKPLAQGTEEEKARKIFAYVRDNFTCTDSRALIAEQSLRNVVKNGKGSVSELNLLLVALLRHAGIAADPVILSTRENGYANAAYPMINRYNYVVAKTLVNSSALLLDASKPYHGFGNIPYYCYNGAARQLDYSGSMIELVPDSLLEKKTTFVNIVNSDGKWQGRFNQVPGIFQSMEIREAIREKGQKAFEKELATELGSAINIGKVVVDSLSNPDVSVRFNCEFDMNLAGEDILYVNPVMEDGYTENPFKAAFRAYPVEMPYQLEKVYIASIQVPEGYVLEEMPKPARMAMNEERDATFDYLVSHSGGTVSMRMVLKVQRTFFEPEEYDILREFFNHVVAKQGEQLVFKKKK